MGATINSDRQILWRAKEDFYLPGQMKDHAGNSLPKVMVASDAQYMGMEVPVWLAWLR